MPNGDAGGRRPIRRVCIYCASSRAADPAYYDAATQLGRLLGQEQITIVYGGGSVGAMGAVANAALAVGGQVVGVIPRFMYDLEWGHAGLTELRIVNDLHERKRLMVDEVDAIIALPGGSGTLEELLEAISWKRLGLHGHPIVVVNTRGFFDPFVTLLDRAIDEHFMDPRHRAMWTVVERIDEVLPAIRTAPAWSAAARSFATI